MRAFTTLKVSFAALVLFVGAHFQTLAQSTSQVQNFPQFPVRIVVSSGPGGGPDTLARLLAEKLSAQWGQPVVVENKPGGGLNIGAEFVYRAAPDGYTLLLTPQSPLVVNKSLYRKLNYDPDALEPVTVLVRVPMVLISNPSISAKSVSDLVQYAKANPGKLNYGSSGSGSTPHLAAELFQAKSGTRMTHVPYKSNPPAVLAVLSGELDMMLLDLGPVLPFIRAGKLRALGVPNEKRHPSLPDVPTIKESLLGVTLAPWWGLMAPPKTPSNIIAKVNQAVVAVLKDAEIVNKLAELGNIEPVGNSPSEAASFIAQERKVWGDLVRSINLSVD